MRFRRIFAGIGEGKRLLAAETETGDEAADDQPVHGRRKRAKDGEDAEQQQVELIDRILRPNRSLNSPWPAVPMNMPKHRVALPTSAASAPVANLD